jgi:peroxiredoxin
MTPQGRSTLLRGAGFVALVALAVAAGLWTGRAVQRARQPDPPPAPAPPAPAPAFAAGDPFPAVPLLAADGAEVSSDALVGERGGVVLFLDPDCPACGEAVAVWQTWLEAGALDGIPVIGVSGDTPESIATYRDGHGLDFPIYTDPGGIFATEHGVTMVPTTVLIDAAGTVRFAGYQPLGVVEPEEIVEKLAG